MTMTTHIPVSIIINNYNYGRFLRESIDSALAQEYSDFEVIVVDDGSTDDSRAIIASYGTKITSILKPNGGQGSALNAGFAICSGEAVVFLDADDILLPTALANVAPLLASPGVSKAHWPLWLIDSTTKRIEGARSTQALPDGDFREQVLEQGLSNVASSPTSGNIWSRKLLEKIMPMPEDVYRLCADDYLYTLAPVFGMVRSLCEPQGCYRIHGNNNYSSCTFDEKLQIELQGYEAQCKALKHILDKNGIPVDLATWRRHSWFHRVEQAIKAILSTVPVKQGFVLVDGNSWGIDGILGGRPVRPFLKQFGMDAGAPADDETALEGLSILLEEGVKYLAIAWPCYWWFDEYPKLFARLDKLADVLVEDDVVVIYQIKTTNPFPLSAQLK